MSPNGELHDVEDAHLSAFCRERGLHYPNMLNHINTASSDQKNGGWRLIDRLRAIGHVDKPHQHVLALGSLEAFYADCQSSDDGRGVLKNRDNLGRLLKDRYNGGKPWLNWQCRHLSTAEKRALLQQPSIPTTAPGSTEASGTAGLQLPNFAAAAVTGFQTDGWRTPSSSSTMAGSLEVLFFAHTAFCSPRTRSH